MIVGIQKEIRTLETHNKVGRVDITLENGQHFRFKEHNGALSIWVDRQLVILPRVSNMLLLEERQL